VFNLRRTCIRFPNSPISLERITRAPRPRMRGRPRDQGRRDGDGVAILRQDALGVQSDHTGDPAFAREQVTVSATAFGSSLSDDDSLNSAE
jgi:hypothetical protein